MKFGNPTSTAFALTIALMLTSTLMACDGDPTEAGPTGPPGLTILNAPQQADAEAIMSDLAVEVRDADGILLPSTALTLAVVAGGGSVASHEVTTDDKGYAILPWTLGMSPVANRLTVTAGDYHLTVEITATRQTLLQAQPFADIDGFLADAEIKGSTENLAFSPQGLLTIGIPGGLATVGPDGTPSQRTLTGDPIVHPLGLAFQDDGTLWVCDSKGPAIRKVSIDGTVTTALTQDGDDDLIAPNDIAIAADGTIVFTDSCLGRIIHLDPADNSVIQSIPFDQATEGGPNGIAFDAAGDLWLATQNTGIICGTPGVEIAEPIASLWKLPVVDGQLGAPTVIAEAVGLFGDGIAFDADGNLWAIFDTEEGFALKESILYVLPKGQNELVKVAAETDRLFANLAFATDAYGITTAYFAMVAVVPFTAANTRGLMRLDLGIEGAALYR